MTRIKIIAINLTAIDVAQTSSIHVGAYAKSLPAALDLIVALIRSLHFLRYDELSSDLLFPYFYLIRCGLSGKLIARVALKGDTGEITYRIRVNFRVSRSYRRHCPEQEEC